MPPHQTRSIVYSALKLRVSKLQDYLCDNRLLLPNPTRGYSDINHMCSSSSQGAYLYPSDALCLQTRIV